VTDRGSTPSASEFAGIGLQFAVSIILFVFAGQWLDRRMGTGPLFLIVGAFVGAGGAFYSMYRKLMASQAAQPDGVPKGAGDRDQKAGRDGDDGKDRSGGR
jgi:ATP synthase protein I